MHAEMNLRHLLEERQEQDRRIAQLEKELASDSVSRPPPKNRGYNNNSDSNKSENGDEQRSQSTVPSGGSSRHRRRSSLPSANDDYDEQQTEILAASNLVSNQITDTVIVPPLGLTGTSEVSRSTSALRSATIPLKLEPRSALKNGDTTSSSASSNYSLEVGVDELCASKDTASGKRPSYPSPGSAVRQHETSTKILTDRNNEAVSQKKSRKAESPFWKIFTTLGKAKSSDVVISRNVSRYSRAPARSNRNKLRDNIEPSDDDSKTSRRQQDRLERLTARNLARMEAMKPQQLLGDSVPAWISGDLVPA